LLNGKHEARLAEIPPSHKRVYCYVGGIFNGHNTAISASVGPLGRMKMLQRRKINRDLARVANLAQLIPAPSLPMLQVLLPSAFF